MAGWTTTSNDHLIRSNLWSAQLKEVFEDELMAMQFVKMITELPDGKPISV